MLSQNDEVMKRLLRDTLPPQSLPAMHPEDFDLMWLGSVSTESGVIAAVTPQLVEGLSLILQPEVVDAR